MVNTQVTQSAVKAALDQFTSQEDGPAGLVFGAVDRTGKMIVQVASGKRGINSSEDMTTDTLLCRDILCSKLITGVALMILVERGIVGLDDPDIIKEKLPEVANAKMIDGNERHGDITLRMLLTHTAGFSYTNIHPVLHKWAAENGVDEHEGTVHGFTQPLVYQPGTRWSYGISIDWAGELLHRVTGKTLDQFCKEEIFGPLGCESIGFERSEGMDFGKLADMHQRPLEGGKLVQIDHYPHVKKLIKGEEQFQSGGSGALGTLTDYLKIVTLLINDGIGGNGRRILKKETVAEMLRDQVDTLPLVKLPDGQEVHTLDAPFPPSPVPTNSFPITPTPFRKGFGITAQIIKDPLPTGRGPSSLTWAGVANLYWMADPVKGIASMILSQSLPFNDSRVVNAYLAAEKALYNNYDV